MGEREAARMMVGGEGAKAENQGSKAFIHACHPHSYPTVTESSPLQ